MELTRDAEKMICIIYKEYLTRRKNGVPKNQAKQFNDFETWSKDLFPNELTEDVKATSCEMCKAFGIRMYIFISISMSIFVEAQSSIETCRNNYIINR